MLDDPGSDREHEAASPDPACPWCSARLPSPDTRVCPSCGARLIEDADVEVPGVTEVDPALRAAAAAPRRVKRTFGSLLVGDDDNEIPPPTEAEMPALARPDADVRREMLLLELEARRAALESEARAIEADEREAAHPAPAVPEAAGAQQPEEDLDRPE